MTVQVFPSILAADFLRLSDEIADISNADGIHLDIMDGVFVPNISFGPDIVRAIRGVTELPLHSHLMIIKPWKYIERFVKAGSGLITVHLETMAQRPQILDEIHNLDVKAGISFNPDVPITDAYPVLEAVEQVLIMSVFAGFGGQSFIEESLRRIETLASYRDKAELTFSIAVDGGVGPANAASIIDAGADLLVAGTSVFGVEDRETRIRELRGERGGMVQESRVIRQS